MRRQRLENIRRDLHEQIEYAKEQDELVWLTDGYLSGRYQGLVEGFEYVLAALGDEDAIKAKKARTL